MAEEFLTRYGTYFGTKIRKPDSNYLFKREGLPNVGKYDMNYFVTDADLLKIEKATIIDSYPHRFELFYKDNTATTLGNMTASVLIGESIIVTCDKNEKATDVINNWNDRINAKGETIEDFMKISFLDNLIDAQHLSRVYINPLEEPKVDVQRVSMFNVNVETHPILGVMRFIQQANVYKKILSKKQFYAKDPNYVDEMETVTTIIPNELNCCIYVKLFDYSPVSTILDYLLKKRWAYWFLRKYMEKHWAPWIIGYVGDPKNGYMPTSPKEQADDLQWAADSIRKIRDFGGAAFPATMKLEVLDTKTQKTGNLYIETIEHLSREIALGLYASITLRESSGVLKSDVQQEVYLRNIRSFREVYSITLRNFYAKVLLPAYDVNDVKPRDIKITFPQLKTENVKDLLQAVEIGAKIGAFKDWKEIRKILNPVWKHVDEDITDEEAKEMKNTFMEINSPSRAMGDSPQSRASGSANNGKPIADKTKLNTKPVANR